MSKFIDAILWNAAEYIFYIAIFFFLFIQIEGDTKTVLLTGLLTYVGTRYINHIQRLDGYCMTFSSILRSLKVLDNNMTTSTGYVWGSQLLWMQQQFYNRKDTTKDIFLPHEVYELRDEDIHSLPDKLGSNSIKKYKESLIAINNKLKHLNFMIKKLHFRENLTVDEKKEIISLICCSNSTGVLYCLNREVPVAKKETEDWIKKLR